MTATSNGSSKKNQFRFLKNLGFISSPPNPKSKHEWLFPAWPSRLWQEKGLIFWCWNNSTVSLTFNSWGRNHTRGSRIWSCRYNQLIQCLFWSETNEAIICLSPDMMNQERVVNQLSRKMKKQMIIWTTKNDNVRSSNDQVEIKLNLIIWLIWKEMGRNNWDGGIIYWILKNNLVIKSCEYLH